MNNISSNLSVLNVGIIGCGNIFPAYAKGCSIFRALRLTSCADIDPAAAQKRADEYQVAARTVDELLADPEVGLVINLTVPKVHAEVSLRALEAGKHVYSEKPLALGTRDGQAILELARKKNLRVGCAPDTFLGAGLQTSRKLIDDGWIGRPVAGTAFMLGNGPESWHPNPAFFYAQGGGPMLDMGPYYITALVHLLGPVAAVSAMTSRSSAARLATCKEKFGELLPVEVATHNSGSLRFQNGAIVTIAVSFDIKGHTHNPIEIYGTRGSLSVPDPNTFGGSVSVYRPEEKAWKPMPLAFGYSENSRSIGAADMAHAIQSGREHRCHIDMALHVLEVMNAFELSQASGKVVEICTPCSQPAAFPQGMPPGLLD